MCQTVLGWCSPGVRSRRCSRPAARGRPGLRDWPGDLSLTRPEAAFLLRAAEVTLGADDVAELHRRTEGWPVGLYLAALYLREGGSLAQSRAVFRRGRPAGKRVRGVGVPGADLPEQREFLIRAAALERMSGPLCEAVLDLPGAAASLEEPGSVEPAAGAAGPAGASGTGITTCSVTCSRPSWNDMSRMIPVCGAGRPAGALHNGLPEEALEYSIAAGDVDAAARLVETARDARLTGRVGFQRSQRWFGWLDKQGGMDGHPMVAVLAALFFAMMGRPAEAERWADAVDRWQYQDAAQPGPARRGARRDPPRAHVPRRGGPVAGRRRRRGTPVCGQR